jgi:hypothetical protein
MAFVVKDRVKETCSSPGTGTVTLLGASTGYVTFASIGNGNSTYYCIADVGGNNWEVGIGTYTASGTTLSRDTVLSNSLGTTALINFSTGTQDVFVTYPSSRSFYGTADQAIAINQTTIYNSVTLPASNNGLSVGTITISSGAVVTVPAGQKWIIL